jgi:transmembrane 9 superfamily member 2/4
MTSDGRCAATGPACVPAHADGACDTQYSQIEWGTRWDNYLHVYDPKIHWFRCAPCLGPYATVVRADGPVCVGGGSLVNSFIIVIFLTFMVAMILLRSLHKDIDRYNQTDAGEAQEDWGWKLVHGDVFRTPARSMLLAVLTGNGVQLLCMSVVTLVLALFGFLSPASRGALMTVTLVFYVLLGFVAGYTSARLYKMFGGENWKTNVLLTAFLLPGCARTCRRPPPPPPPPRSPCHGAHQPSAPLCVPSPLTLPCGG